MILTSEACMQDEHSSCTSPRCDCRCHAGKNSRPNEETPFRPIGSNASLSTVIYIYAQTPTPPHTHRAVPPITTVLLS